MWILLVVLVLGTVVVKVVKSVSPETDVNKIAVWVAGGVMLLFVLAVWSAN